MEFERDTFLKVTAARSQYQRAVTIDQKAQAEESLASALADSSMWPKLSGAEGQRKFL
jgi:hypothetical protein